MKNGTLSYWKSQSEVNRKPQGQIGLGEACKISRNDGAATFEIYTGSRTYYLTADSIATMEDWIRVLQVIKTISFFLFHIGNLFIIFDIHIFCYMFILRMCKDEMQQNFF